MAKEKVANYSAEAVETLKTYNPEAGNKAELARLSEAVGKSVPSVRSKLSTMGLYVAEVKATKASTGNKASIVESIVEAGVELNAAEMEGLQNATKAPLEKILAALTVEPASSEVAESESEA